MLLRHDVAPQSSRGGPRSANSFAIGRPYHVCHSTCHARHMVAIEIDSLSISGQDRHRLSPTYERQQMRNEVTDRWWQLKCTSCTALTAK
jgi:hypothetical protein